MTNTTETWLAGQTALLDVTLTQGGAGTVILDIVPGTGNEFEVLWGQAIYVGTNSIQISPISAIAGSGLSIWTKVASVASAAFFFPALHTHAASAADTTSSEGWPLHPIISGVMSLNFTCAGAGGGADTLRISIAVRAKGAMPTATPSGTSTPTVTAGSILFSTR